MSEETVAQEAVLDEKDITALVEDAEEELSELEELASEEESGEVEEVEERELMSEEEFNERIDEFQEKDHSLTIFANYYVKTLEKKARENNLDVDFSLWWDVGRPSFNAGLWYMEKVEGTTIQVSGKFGLLVGAGSLLLLTWMYKNAMKKKRTKKSESASKNEEKPVRTETEALRERAKPKEPEKPKSELLEKISKNLGG